MQMTWITDGGGTRWFDVTKKKKPRKTPRPLKFGEIKVGDQVMQKPRADWGTKVPIYYQITDLWFDPVAGEDDPVKGQMVGLAQIKQDGTLRGKSSTTVRGLASQQYDYADIDYIAMCRARTEAFASGAVVGIGYGKTIRSRPKISGL